VRAIDCERDDLWAASGSKLESAWLFIVDSKYGATNPLSAGYRISGQLFEENAGMGKLFESGLEPHDDQ
jgi:hypothetical protein